MSAEEAIAQAKSRLESLLAPINGGVGDDVSYDESLEAIKTEIDKQNQIDGGKIEWPNVESLSANLLTDRSKDFRVALYWGVARTQVAGLDGFFEGLVLLNELNNTFWEPMYPALKRPRARAALLSWYNELITPIVNHAAPTPKQRAAVLGIGQLFREIDGFLADKLGDAYPGMVTLSEGVRGLMMRVPAEAAPPPPPPPPTAAQAPAPEAAPPSVSRPSVAAAPVSAAAPAAAPAATIEITDGDSAYQALAEVAPILGRASGAIFNADVASADAYRLWCQSLWLLVGGEPFNQGGQTTLTGPGEAARQTLRDLAAASDWVGLANNAYQYASEFPFWLDALRALATSLEQQGEGYTLAKSVVERETAALLARAPTLPTLTWADGSPFAEPDTQAWVQGLGSGGGGGGAARSPVERAIADATKLSNEGQLPQAMGVLSRAAAQASPAQRFVARLEVAKLALQNQLFDMARAQLEALERTAEEHRLATWDPALATELYANLYKVRRAIAQNVMDDGEIGKRVAQSFERLCELDAARAYQVMNEA